MRVDYLIVGQGLCGTFLSHSLWAAGKQVLVVDEDRPFTASKVASGVINPVTGKRRVRSWLMDQLMPYALEAYREMEQILGLPLIRPCNILDFHESAEDARFFEERMEALPEHLHRINNERSWASCFQLEHGIGEIDPCWLIDLRALLKGWRSKLKEEGLLLEQRFVLEECEILPGGVNFRNITASKIIFCDGAAGYELPYFRQLPYARNKGEVILASIPDLPVTHIYKQGLSLVPWGGDHFWIGSTYDWNFEHLEPTEAFRHKVTARLDHWLRLPYTLLDHWAAERPANMDRRPFAGLHPYMESVGLLNGMGTKGCSMAPFFARQLSRLLTEGVPVMPEVDVRRFTRALGRE